MRLNWESLRADIENIIKDKELTKAEFKLLGIHDDWKIIEQNIYHTFVSLTILHKDQFGYGNILSWTPSGFQLNVLTGIWTNY